ADHVDHGIGPQVAHARPECPGGILGITVGHNLLNRFPGCVQLIRLALTAADRNHLMAGGQQTWHKIGSDMAAASDDHDPPRYPPIPISRKRHAVHVSEKWHTSCLIILGVTRLGVWEGKALQRTFFFYPPVAALPPQVGRKRRFSGPAAPAPLLKRQLRKS